MKSRVATLQSIELAGFKSFSKRTKIEFGKGLVAIVGPNGSGKSNIADAIRWVFGEQKSRSLRTDKSEDLIYHGGNGKARASMAEVVIRLDNSAGAIPIDLNEIEITRRLYRSGESNYLLNGRKASLSSIQEVLAGSGFGVGSYTVIGQGMIDKLILSTGKERKQLFEEASGIKQYEIKYGQTLKRIQSTAENLDEINKLISELGPQHDSLTKQAELLDKKNRLNHDLIDCKAGYINDELNIKGKLLNESLQKLKIANNNLKSLDKEIIRLEKSSAKINSIDSKTKLEKINSELIKLEADKEKIEIEISNISLKVEARKSIVNESAQLAILSRSELNALEETMKAHIKDQKQIEKIVNNYEKKLSEIDKKIQAQTKDLDIARMQLGKSQKSEYLSHSLGLIDIIQDGIKRDKSEQELSIAFYKLRRMLKHSMADNSAELALKVGKIQNTIARLLDERENINESQTNEVIKLRAIEMDSSSIESRVKELNKNIKQLESHNKNNKSHRAIEKLEEEIEDCEKIKDKLSTSIASKREELVELAQFGNNETIDEYYSEHEALTNNRVGLVAEIESIKIDIDSIEVGIKEINQTKILWFPYKTPKPKVNKTISLADINRLEAEMDLLEEISPEVSKELSESSKRMKYLEGQSRDLARALANLEKVAKDTEGKIKAIFEKGFKSINENFAKNFKDLFGGGEAELKLSRGDDDYGVEIIVKLPNKNAQNIASLSGGEKALASVALLSGILVSNPSPFVVLDEVDAALDEENTKRFASIISKITDHSQVLVVTHNHETMAVADELLGVTTSGNNESSIIRVELGSFPLEAAK